MAAFDPIITAYPVDGDADHDQAVSRDLLERVASGTSSGALRIWRPVPALALSRLDTHRPGAASATAAAQQAGFPTIVRMSGGHAVVLGRGSLCVGLAEPARTFEDTGGRYRRMTDALIATLGELGVEAEQGELDGEWCPGAWSIRSGSVKLAGLAQRAIKGAAWVEAVLELEPDAGARDLLRAAYAALELPLDVATAGSLSEVRGAAVSFEEVAESLAAHLQRR